MKNLPKEHLPRRIAYCFIPHFPVAVEVREEPSLLAKPVVVGGEPYEDAPVLDASPEAIELGVRPGMPLRHAYSFCPEARFLPWDGDKYQRAFEEVLKVLESFSPLVEPEGLGGVYLDMTGSEDLFGPDQMMAKKIVYEIRDKTGFLARVGVASNKFAARVAALGSDGHRVVPNGEEAAFLKEFPVHILPMEEDALRRLHLLGIERVEEYRSLPAGGVAVQFGKEGQGAYQLALGMDNNPVLGRAQPPTLEIRQTYWTAIDNLDWLFAEVDLLLEPLVVQLKEGGWMCQEVHLLFELDDDRIHEAKLALDSPSASLRELQGRAHRLLERQTYGAAVAGIKVSLSGLSSLEGKQLSLETMTIRQRKRLQLAIEHLKQKYGRGLIKMAWLLDPTAPIPSERFVLTEWGEKPE